MNIKKSYVSTILIFLSTFFTNFYAQNFIIDYYGISYESIDANMAKMTSDLYYTQLCEISNFSVNDKRIASTESFSPDKIDESDNNLIFYTEVKKVDDTSKWETVIHVINKQENSEHTKKNQYDSFYKILMESKQTLQTTIKNLIENNTIEEENSDEDDIFNSSAEVVSSENLSGTWKGEDYIDKIVILRGGRGFVIFKNGASMNISISIDESANTVKILQNGRSNASFFPDLPRTLALSAAVSADPIEWNLNLKDKNTLTGTKKTLVPNNDSYIAKSVNVTWNKIN